jgi:hypothetical protein
MVAWYFEMVQQLASQLDSLSLVLRSAATSSLISLPRATRSVKDPHELNVIFHEVKYTPHDVFLYWVGCWFLGSDECNLLRRKVVETPAWFVDCHTQRSTVLFVVLGGIVGEGDKVSSANDFPQAIDAHDGLLLVVLERMPLRVKHDSP